MKPIFNQNLSIHSSIPSIILHASTQTSTHPVSILCSMNSLFVYSLCIHLPIHSSIYLSASQSCISLSKHLGSIQSSILSVHIHLSSLYSSTQSSTSCPFIHPPFQAFYQSCNRQTINLFPVRQQNSFIYTSSVHASFNLYVPIHPVTICSVSKLPTRLISDTHPPIPSFVHPLSIHPTIHLLPI